MSHARIASIAIVSLLAACGKSEPAGSLAPPTTQPVVIADPIISSDVIPAETLQLVTAIIPGWEATTAELRLWERPDARTPWKQALGPWRGVIGHSGAGCLTTSRSR